MYDNSDVDSKCENRQLFQAERTGGGGGSTEVEGRRMAWSREWSTELDLVRRTLEPPFLSVFAFVNSEALTQGTVIHNMLLKHNRQIFHFLLLIQLPMAQICVTRKQKFLKSGSQNLPLEFLKFSEMQLLLLFEITQV